MAYTPSANKAGNTVAANQGNATPTSRSNFGNFRVDSGRNSMVGYANNFVTQDATPTTPVTSPTTVTATTTLIVPLNAISLTVVSVTNAVQISEDSTQSVFFTLPAATVYTLYCANQANVYIKAGSSTVVSFMFQTV
jgi:hypothetical protein